MSRPILHSLLAALLLLGSGVSQATTLGDDLLAPAAPRPAPRSRPEIAPRPVIFTSRSVIYATRSGDGRWIATVEKGDEGDELWLQPTGNSPELPRLLLTSPVRLTTPALNNNGTLLAFSDARDDVKGDIWLFDLAKSDREPQRLTGPESADDAPVFTIDGAALVYQRQLPGVDRRELVRLDYRTGKSSVLPVGIDAGFSAPAPDGARWVLVSRADDPGGDLWLWNERTGERQQLTAGADRDLYPVWEGDGALLFTRFAATGEGAAGQIFRLHLDRTGDDGRPALFPLTAGTLSAVAPLPAGDSFLFVGGQGSGGQLLSLPASGEIPQQRSVTAQWELAQRIINRQPPDLPHARLAAWRVLAMEEAPSRQGALAGIALGRLLESDNDPDGAVAAYTAVTRRSSAFPQEAALAEIARLRVATAKRCAGERDAGIRTRLIGEAQQAMASAAGNKSGDAAARAFIDAGRLLTDFGSGARDQLTAIGLLEQAKAVTDASRLLLAEAAYRRAALLARLEKGEGALTALVTVARDYDDQEEWAESAITAILDQLVTVEAAGQSGYAALGERYRTELPRLAMGAWNRIGDLAFRDNEWAKAKDAYRTVLEKFPPLPTPTAAARFALAEILYREERYAEATALYEQEMAGQAEDAPLYGLARAAYIRKTLAAGENLYRTGEVAAARAAFLDLIRYDGRSIEAHRGYIKSVASQGQAEELLGLYNRLLQRYPDDPVLLYASGLTETYLPGQEHLAAADQRIARAADRMPESEYPPQTRGYIAEVMETVQGERGGLERAMQLYRRAWLLNRGRENPENRANLDLNIGNIAYLLGSNATAWNHYRRRLAAAIPFDNPETELIFLQRYAAVAFQMREKEEPITGYTRALQLAESRIKPALPLELSGRLTRRIMERLFQDKLLSGAAEKALQEQQDINAELERLGSSVPEAPPSVGWDRFAEALRQQLKRERGLLDNAASWHREAMARSGVELQALLKRAEESLADVPRLVETAAELHDRLGLALLEAERFGPARGQFDTAFGLNKGLGRTANLAANRRSASIAAYREAQTVSGEERLRLLSLARDGFREQLSLIKLYPPQMKKAASRGSGLITIAATVALDKGGSTQAAYGFSAVQEERLAETYLARILSELGEPAAAGELLKRQLERYPEENSRINVRDLYGVGLLTHRTAHVAYALNDRIESAAGFRRSTLLSLQAGNPVSAMLNLVNWGELTADTRAADQVADFLKLEAETTQLANSYRNTLPPLALARYHNDVGVILSRRANSQPDDISRQALLYRAIEQWDRALAAAKNREEGSERDRLLLRSAAHLNKGTVLTGLRLADVAETARKTALDDARSGRVDGYVWRALAGLGRYEEALQELERLSPAAYGVTLGEIRERFAPRLAELAASDPEQGFALLEWLSELERVHIIGKSLLALDDPAVLGVLAAVAPHLAELDRLNGRLAGAAAVDREYLELRQRQEQTLVDDLLGKDLERLPPFYRRTGAGLIRLAAAAAALQAGAETSAMPEAEAAARQRFLDLQRSYHKACIAGTEGRLCRAVTPQPAEAVDILEMMPGRTILRFTPLDEQRWLLFTVGGKPGVRAETVDMAGLTTRLAAVPPVLAAYEEPQQFGNTPVAGWGLSATQLLRTLEERRPFRRQVLDPAGWWPTGANFTKLAPERPEERLAFAHTMILPGRAGLLPRVPSEPGQGETQAPLWEETNGVRRPLLDFAAANGLSLVIAPQAGVEAAYGLGHLLTLAGVPSLLLSDRSSSVPPQFVAAYGTGAVGTARATLPAGWLLVGDTGPDAAEAARVGKRQFMTFGKEGVQAHNSHRYTEALALFENALAIADENVDLAKQRAVLHRYARESAYAAGDTERAILHATALLQLVAKEKPYSADHADAFLRLGLLQGRAERFIEAAVSLKEAVAIFADLGLAKEQAGALADFGVVMENAVEYPTARSLFEEAAGIRRTLKDELPLAEQYRNLGRLHDLRLNQCALAEQYYAKAGEIYSRAGNKGLEAETLLERGRCQRLLGNFPAADGLYDRALKMVGDRELRTRMRIVLEQANNAWFQGRYQEAFDLREQVEKASKRENWPLEQVMARNTGGLIWWTLGDNHRALLELREALSRAEKLEVRRDEVATTLNNIGLVQRESGDYQAALATLDKALAIDRTLGSRWAMAYDLRNLAQTRLRMGDPKTAVQLLTEAGALAGAIGDQVNLAKIFLARGDAEAALKDTASATASYRRALEAADTMLLREVRWRALFGLARLQQAAGEMETAVATFRQAINTVEDLRAEIRLDQLKDGFLANKQELYAALVGLLVDLQRGDEAFAVAERSRARNLIDILGRQRLSLNGAADRELYERQNRLREKILEQETLAAQANPKDKVIYGSALERLQADYQDLLLEIERQRPELLSLVKVQPVQLAEVRQQLEPGVILLSYYQLTDRLLCWRIGHDEASLFIFPVTAQELAESISSYRRMLQNLEPLEKQSRELYDRLLAKPLAGLGEMKALGIIPHGPLHYLSFATLSDGRDYVVDRQQLFYLPATSVLRYTLSRRQSAKNLRVLAIGNPDLGDPSLDLPFAEREAGVLRWDYPSVTTLTRERATESWVREHIGEFGIIHLASHGEFDPVNPLFSAIRLAPDKKSDGRLMAEDIFGLQIKADLVVLSACQTGLGEIRKGDDVVGMNRAFIFAGTHALMSSLWRVSDVSTAILMKQFYREYSRNDKAESLRRAMLHVKNRYPHPGYWGAFTLIGDFR
ncbi:tetratricopeptide repeat protein 28 [Geobacter sp. OR-1]|uniref:CHAT domain-containing protein n=1 Tax=Geobacter sp. OR-1 TaxID=1266765 RepID=UPI00054420F9|nr:CHAT domain-containing protein [Geobacter sp. OR-1]GAM09838.1 tetratricopeptide repeat protein 28 [Geobacter sp. OR-1]